MALIWKTQETTPVPAPKGFNWDEWYSKNKARLSVKRAKRYREDPAYRAAALARSRQQRSVKKPAVVDGHTVSFNDAARALDVTVWVLREWRRKNYFPEPHRREGRLWFTMAQVHLLQRIKTFFDEHGVRVAEAQRPELENLVGLVYSNWN